MPNHDIYTSYNIHCTKANPGFILITPPILPPRPPPLLPLRAIKLLLSKLLINIIMRLAHPLSKLLSALRPYFILRHPVLEILGADPTRIQL